MQGGKAHGNYDYCSNLHFFIFCDIWSTVENYFQKILSPLPLKKSLPPFFSLPSPPPKKIKKCKSPLFANIENFSGPPCREQGFSMTAFITMMLSVVDLFFFPAVCILDMLLCTTSFWFFFTISYALDTIFVMKIPLWLSWFFFLLIHFLCVVTLFRLSPL